MIDRGFLADLVRDPGRVLADYDLSTEERSVIMEAARKSGSSPEPERERALQIVLMKRWAT